MKFSAAAILSFAVVASAIDLYGHDNGDCSGGGMVCTNINPSNCCVRGEGRGVASMALRGIPIGWLVELKAFTGGNCNNLAATVGSGGGQNFVCARGGYYTGAYYTFYGRKRDETVEPECQKVRADILFLADGTRYDVSGLDDATFDALTPLGLNATSHEEVPDELKPLRIE